jgi:ATP-dependent DNA helicase PIF1
LNPSNLSPKQQKVVALYLDKKNIFISGSAGTGKSYLLNFLKINFSNDSLQITSSTGVSAVNIGGATIHSWSGIGLANQPVEKIIENIFTPKFSKIRQRIIHTKTLAIDEISMISKQTFEIIDQVFKKVRKNTKPFGGIQVLFFGDFLQLPPVSGFNEQHEFCFKSEVWRDLELYNIILDTSFRQKDQYFIKLLNNLRIGKIDAEDKTSLLSRLNIVDHNSIIRPTILTTHNYKVLAVNENYLKNIPHKELVFNAEFEGDQYKIEFLQKNCVAYKQLRLKVGSQVMMIKNTLSKEGIVNGSLGIVKDFSAKKNYPIVEFANNKIMTISPESWAYEQYDVKTNLLKIEATMTQIPLILSWAITIHKSQGLTLDKISCDLEHSFSAGQSYVALSRARSLEGVFLESLNFNKIIVSSEAVNFYNEIDNF